MTKQISEKTREKRVSDFIKRYKFLYDKKYYKTNKVSCAHYESWAAQGKAGGCSICNTKHYNYTIHNKRWTKKYKESTNTSWSFNGMGNLCTFCYYEVEKQCDYGFVKY